MVKLLLEFVLVALALHIAVATDEVVAVPVVSKSDIFGGLKLPGGQPFKAVPQLQAQPPGVITLHNSEHTIKTITKADGTFIFRQVPEGVYMLLAEFAHLQFPLLRVSVIETRTGTLRIRATVNDGTQQSVEGDGTFDAPLELTAVGRHVYFVPREEFSVLSLFKNPMILMMVVSFGLMGLMKLVPQEELKQQMKEMNKQVQESKQQLGIEKKAQ